jgi:hypothetical protein
MGREMQSRKAQVRPGGDRDSGCGRASVDGHRSRLWYEGRVGWEMFPRRFLLDVEKFRDEGHCGRLEGVTQTPFPDI